MTAEIICLELCLAAYAADLNLNVRSLNHFTSPYGQGRKTNINTSDGVTSPGGTPD